MEGLSIEQCNGLGRTNCFLRIGITSDAKFCNDENYCRLNVGMTLRTASAFAASQEQSWSCRSSFQECDLFVSMTSRCEFNLFPTARNI